MFYEWNSEKNDKLKKERGIGFEQVVEAITSNNLIKVEKNPNKKYSNQFIYIIKINNYCYLIPFVKDNNVAFLKTIIPSRKATKKYILKFIN